MNKTWSIQPFDNDTPTSARKLEEERYAYCISVSYKYACCISLMLQAEQTAEHGNTTGSWQNLLPYYITEGVEMWKVSLHQAVMATFTSLRMHGMCTWYYFFPEMRLHPISISTNGNTIAFGAHATITAGISVPEMHLLLVYYHQQCLLRDHPSAITGPVRPKRHSSISSHEWVPASYTTLLLRICLSAKLEA